MPILGMRIPEKDQKVLEKFRLAVPKGKLMKLKERYGKERMNE